MPWTASSLPLDRALDAGLRPGPFPDRTASLLPGLLAATRTGLTPAGDDELTNSNIHHGATPRCHLPFCWAHERSGLGCLILSGLRILIGSSRKGQDHVTEKYRKFSPEFREEAARMVVETSRPIADVARELGISETSLGNWVRAYREKHADDEPPLQTSERARLREPERENRELRMKAEFLSKAAAYFAAEHR